MADVLTSYVKFLRGTPSAYNNLAFKDSDTLYFVSEPNSTIGQLYLGDRAIITGDVTESEVANYLYQLKDVDTAGAVQNSILGYDAESAKWVVMDVNNLISQSVMVGASATVSGEKGLVPAPEAGQEGYFLRGDGKWAKVDTEEIENRLNDIDNSIEDLSIIVDTKVNASSVYTKEETDNLIAQEISKVNHLTRKTFDTIEDAEAFILLEENPEKYVYLILTSDNLSEHNRYDEYLYIEGKLEKVGSWETDLSGYVEKEPGKSLVSNSEIEKLLTVAMNAQENYVKSIDELYFDIDVNGKLGLKPIEISHVKGLDELFVTTETGVSIDINNVIGLDNWISDNRNSIQGLMSTEIENDIQKAISDLNSLTVDVQANTRQIDINLSNINALNTKVADIAQSLTNFVSAMEYENRMAKAEEDIDTVKNAVTWQSI